MAHPPTRSVLVVGAGPTGLALACGLRLHGVPVRVIDQAAGPATTSRANFLHARGSEVLRRLGALGDLPAASVRAMQITTYLGDRPVMRLRFGDPGLRTAAPPMVISQAKVEAELRRRLAGLGVTPEWNTRLVGARQDADGVTVALGAGETARVAWLVGCDGTGSATREAAGIGYPGVRLSETFLLADLILDWDLDRTGTSGWIHPDGMLGAMPMPDPDGGDRCWRLIAYDPEHGAHASEDEILERFRRILPERTGIRDVRVERAVWLSRFTVHRRLADSYRNGRILLAGDAAHAHAPFGGQGMLTGLGDAENLAWKLALVVQGRAADRLLDTYEAERRPLASDVLRGTSAVTRINIARGRFGRFVRDRILVRLLDLPAIQRRTTYTASQLWVSYRRGPLGSTRGPKPRPGDRIDDRECRRPDGAPTRLHDELGGRWALLVPPGRGHDAVPSSRDHGVTPPVDRCVRELLGEAATTLERTDGRDEAWLVRPDGHLAWRGASGPSGAADLRRRWEGFLT